MKISHNFTIAPCLKYFECGSIFQVYLGIDISIGQLKQHFQWVPWSGPGQGHHVTQRRGYLQMPLESKSVRCLRRICVCLWILGRYKPVKPVFSFLVIH